MIGIGDEIESDSGDESLLKSLAARDLLDGPAMTLPFVLLLAVMPFDWIAVGPERGTVTAIALGETTLAGTAQGRLFQWTGSEWLETGRHDGPIREIVTRGDEIWVLADKDLFRSGRRLAAEIEAFAVAPSDPEAVYLAREGSATSIAVDAVDASTLWITRPDGRLEKSIDGGRTFLAASMTVPIRRVQTHPRRAGTAYAIGDDGRGFRTVDGVNWTELFYLTGRLVFERGRDNAFFVIDDEGRLFHSDDDGDWLDVIHGGRIRSLAIGDDGALVAGFREEGVQRSFDGGHTWIPQRAGLLATEIHTLAASADGGVVYAGSVNTMFRSVNHGLSWDPVFTLRLLPGPFSAIAIDPSDSRRVLIASGHEAWYSGDGAVRFNRRFHHPSRAPQSIVAMAFDPIEPGSFFVAMTESVFHQDVDVTPQGGGRFHALSVSGGIWLAGERNGRALVLRSTDRGRTWSDRSPLADPITALFTGSSLFAGTASGAILRSDDGGLSWRTVAQLPAAVRSIVSDGATLLAAAAGVYASTDGATWVPVTGSLHDESVTTLTASSPMFAGTAGSGVFIRRPGEIRRRAARR